MEARQILNKHKVWSDDGLKGYHTDKSLEVAMEEYSSLRVKQALDDRADVLPTETMVNRILKETGSINVETFRFIDGYWAIQYKNGLPPDRFEFFADALDFLQNEGND